MSEGHKSSKSCEQQQPPVVAAPRASYVRLAHSDMCMQTHKKQASNSDL